jgi:hypothetical protein
MVFYEYKNKTTGEVVELSRLIKDRNLGPDDKDVTTGDSEWEKVITAPNFTSVSYLDGQKRPKSEGFDGIKQAAKLKQARADATDFHEKRAIDKEIAKVEKSKG